MQDTSTSRVEWHSLAPGEVAAARNWFVEADGSYVGPVEVGEVERQWRAGEITDATRVWSEGMSDWRPLTDVPDLLYLLIQHPHGTARPAVVPPTWTLTQAASLASLVHSELEALTGRRLGVAAPAFDPPRPAGLPELQSVGGREPFARRWTDWGASLEPMSWPVDPWRARVASRSPLPAWRIVLGAASAAALVALVVVLADVVRPGGAALEPRDEARASPSPAAGATRWRAPREKVEPQAAPRPEITDLPALVPVAPAPTAVARGAPPARARSGAGTGRPVARAAAAGPARAPPLPPAEAGPAEALTPREVVAATREQLKDLAPCIRRARRDGELESRKYTFVLDWLIRANGTVARPSLTGPPEALTTTLRACFEAAMRRWRYRQSAQDFEVGNFPLPVTVR